MGSTSDAFRLVETGGDPRLHPSLDYTLFLPLLISRYSLDSVPFLSRYPQTWTVSKYLDLDYRLIQRQVKEELQLEKQNIGSSTSITRIREFEMGTNEDRVRIVLLELAKLNQDQMEQRHSTGTINGTKTQSTLLNNPIYRLEVSSVLAMCTLLCRHPILDIQMIVKSLQSIHDPAPLITTIIANNPMEFSSTIESLLNSVDYHSNSKTILLRLCKLADHKIWGVRQRLIEKKVFSNLAIELTIEHCHDEICFMNRVLQGQPEWLTNGIDPVTKTSLTSIMEFVFSSLNDELTSEQPDNISINRLLRILSGMIGLMNLSLNNEQLEISLGVLEMSPLVPSTVDVKICFILMSAGQLLKYSHPRVERILHQMIQCHESPQVLNLLIYFQQKQLLKIDDIASKSLSMLIVIPRAGLMELSSTFTSLFSDEELSQCSLKIGRSTLSDSGLASSQSTMALATTTDSDQNAINGNPELRSTANLIVGHLLQQDVFHNNATDVQRWVMEQIQASTVPLDANIIHLLRAYTLAIARSDHITRIPEQDIRVYFRNPSDDPTPAKVLLVLYMLMNNDVCVANLGSSNMERLREYSASLLEHIQVRKVALYVQDYQAGVAFRAVQPIFLKLVNSQFPELFDVTTLLMEENISTSVIINSPPEVKELNRPPMTPQDVATFMASHLRAIQQHLNNPDAAVKGFHAFQRLTQGARQSMASTIIQASLPSLLDPQSNPSVMEAFKNTWDQLNSVMPHELWALTIQALLPTSSPTPSIVNVVSKSIPSNEVHNISKDVVDKHQWQQRLQQPQQDYYTFEWLVQDPLLLFKVDFRVFRSPMIFRLFIQILGAVMVGSRHWFRKQFHASQAIPLAPQNRNPSQVQRRQFKEVNLSTMLYIQDTTLIQLMLEACEARPEDLMHSAKSAQGKQSRIGKQVKAAKGDKENPKDAQSLPKMDISDALQEVRVVTFNFLHQLFIDHKIFPKLVHFQGYAMDLLPVTVAGIDSIHVCLDFLQELLFSNAPTSMLAPSNNTPAGTGSPNVKADAAPQIFALRLAAHLCLRFPLRNTLQMAEDFILPRLQVLAINTGFASDVLESSIILAKAFPSLRAEIIRILKETSGPQDKIVLQRTIDTIDLELQDPRVLDKSTL